MGQPAEMVDILSDQPLESDLVQPFSARKALALWVALSAIGWAAIAMMLEVAFF